jgi:hypothetical protein
LSKTRYIVTEYNRKSSGSPKIIFRGNNKDILREKLVKYVSKILNNICRKSDDEDCQDFADSIIDDLKKLPLNKRFNPKKLSKDIGKENYITWSIDEVKSKALW